MHDAHLPRETVVHVLLLSIDMEFGHQVSAALATHDIVVHAANISERVGRLARSLLIGALIIDTDCPVLRDAGVARWVGKMKNRLPILYLVAPTQTDQIAFSRNENDMPHDFVVAPYLPEETAIRLLQVMRLFRLQGHSSVLCMGTLVINDAAHQMTVDDVEIELTPNEYRVLKYLVAHGSRPASKQEMVDALFPARDNAPNLLEVHISRLRRRLVRANVQIRSIRGYGYLIEIQQ